MNQEERVHANLPYLAWLNGLSEQRLENKKSWEDLQRHLNSLEHSALKI